LPPINLKGGGLLGGVLPKKEKNSSIPIDSNLILITYKNRGIPPGEKEEGGEGKKENLPLLFIVTGQKRPRFLSFRRPEDQKEGGGEKEKKERGDCRSW